jgi:hypothetical protein
MLTTLGQRLLVTLGLWVQHQANQVQLHTCGHWGSSSWCLQTTKCSISRAIYSSIAHGPSGSADKISSLEIEVRLVETWRWR